MFSPLTKIGEPVPLTLGPPGLAVTVKLVMAEPLLAGGVKLTLALALPAVAVPIVGAFGAPAGVTLFDGAEGELGPTALVATTVNVYAVPLVKPVMVCDSPVVPAFRSTPPAGLEETV